MHCTIPTTWFRKTLNICRSRGLVSIAHTIIHPHNLTFISLRRKGFNQDFIKRYLCNALLPGGAAGMLLRFSSNFPTKICRRERRK